MSESATETDGRHERRDVSAKGLVIFGGLFAAFLLVVSGLLFVLFGTHRGQFSAAQTLGQELPGDELEQRDQLASYMQGQTGELDRLAWTDATHQFAKVPIDDAMKLLAAKGSAR